MNLENGACVRRIYPEKEIQLISLCGNAPCLTSFNLVILKSWGIFVYKGIPKP